MGTFGDHVRARRHHETAGDDHDGDGRHDRHAPVRETAERHRRGLPDIAGDDIPFGEPLRDDRLVGVRAGQRDVLALERSAALHPDEGLRAVVRDCVERDDERSGRARELARRATP